MKSKKIKGLILLVFFLINLMCPNLGVAQNPPLSNSYAPSPDAAAMIKTIEVLT